MEFSKPVLDLLEKRYLLKDERGNIIETPEDMFRRVANFIGDTKEEKEKFFEIMSNLEFLPSSPVLFNAGTEHPMMFACFVLPIEDSIESIFSTLMHAAKIFQRGGGVGYDFSRLRPKGSLIRTSKGTSSGPVSFMQLYDAMAEVVRSGGKRRGAQIAVLRVDHPDIEEFITCKNEEGRLSNFNISVGITDEFMRAVKENGYYQLSHPMSPKPIRKKARHIWKMIVENAWRNGEPGLLFLDTINRHHSLNEPIRSANPCSEALLRDNESCDLGSINFTRMVKKGKIDWDRFREVIHLGVRFLDNVIDKNEYILPQIEKAVKESRKIGLGLMGWADALIMLGIRYDSEEALKLAEKVAKFMYEEAEKASVKLAEEKGAFPLFEKSKLKKKRRNASLLSIAPTGSISLIAGVSSGIEPVFSTSYIHIDQEGDIIKVEKELYKKNPEIVRTAKDIPYEYHIKMQAAFQKHVDMGISKTINMPNDATFEDVEKAYMLAWELGCKGITIYREGSRKKEVLVDTKRVEVPKKEKERPEILDGKTIKMKTGCGSLYVTMNYTENGKPIEVFARLGRSGGCASCQTEAVGRLISLALRYDIPLDEITRQIKGISCDKPVGVSRNKIYSCVDAIGKGIERISKITVEDNHEASRTCPSCGAPLVPEGKCEYCPSCGYSACG